MTRREWRRAGGRWRNRIVRLLSGRGDAPVILMYHRIAEPGFDPWGLSVSEACFADQLDALAKHRTIISLEALVYGLATGTLPPRATVLTFDDGCRDNALVAAPMLRAKGACATIFLTTGPIASGEPFWWDELAAIALDAAGTAAVAAFLAEPAVASRAPPETVVAADLARWRDGATMAAYPREAAFLTVWHVLHAMDEHSRSAAMARFRAAVPPIEPVDPSGLPMDRAMVAALAGTSIALGGHGRSHAALPRLAPADMRREIVVGRREVRQWSGQAARMFAYPHGAWDPATRTAVARAGFAGAVTTRHGAVDVARYDALALPRLAVGNWSGRRLLAEIDGAPVVA